MNLEEINNKDGFYITVNLVSTVPQTAANYGLFFTATRPCEVLKVKEVHTVAGDDNATLDIEKLTGTTAIESGSSILTAVFDLTSTANTVVTKSGTGLSSSRGLLEGDRLALKDGGNLTVIEGVQVTLYLIPRGKGEYR